MPLFGIVAMNAAAPSRLFCFGLGYSAAALIARLGREGFGLAGTTRDAEKAERFATRGVAVFPFDGTGPVADGALDGATHILVSVPPDGDGDPVLRHHRAALARLTRSDTPLRWLGYLSTTGVYGDHGGGWVDEGSALRPSSDRARRRVEAERAWLQAADEDALPVHIFRLAGIYGPGRSALDQLRAGTARRIDAPGRLFSRFHVDDIGTVLAASMAGPRPGAIYNLCDDEAAEPAAVTEYAAGLLGVTPPPLVPLAEAELTPMARSFWADDKRVRNDRIKTELGVRLAYPDYRAGLKAIHDSAGINRVPTP